MFTKLSRFVSDCDSITQETVSAVSRASETFHLPEVLKIDVLLALISFVPVNTALAQYRVTAAAL